MMVPTGVAAPAPTDLETVTIGDQVWLARNLDATHFANGDPIPRITGEAAWAAAGASGAPAQSAYDNDETRVARDGLLYNYAAIQDPRGLCPQGFRLQRQLLQLLRRRTGVCRIALDQHLADTRVTCASGVAFAAGSGGGVFAGEELGANAERLVERVTEAEHPGVAAGGADGAADLVGEGLEGELLIGRGKRAGDRIAGAGFGLVFEKHVDGFLEAAMEKLLEAVEGRADGVGHGVGR
mgnify:CR=1 FL=1